MTLFEFMAVWSVATGAAVWLYLRHRQPRRRLVSTLRFWQSLEAASPTHRRRRIQEPWALLAQLLFLLLLIAALADPKWDWTTFEPGHVALVVDTSVWSQARPSGETPWLDQAREQAERVLDGLSASDRVLLLRAEADASPAVPFTADHASIRRALAGLRPSDTVADVPRALETARAALAGRSRAMLVYIGPGIIDEAQQQRLDEFRRSLASESAGRQPKLWVRLIGARRAPLPNIGITRLALRRDPAQPERWHLLVQVRNYGAETVSARLRFTLDGRRLTTHGGSRAREEEQALAPGAGELVGARAEFTSTQGGVLLAELTPADALAADNRAIAYVPRFRPLRVAVFSSDPKALRSGLAANPYLRAEFLRPGESPAAGSRPDVAIYDSGVPSEALPASWHATHAMILQAGAGAKSVRLTAWNPQHPVTRWIRTRDVTVRSVEPLRPAAADVVLAWADTAPLMLAREIGGRKALLLAFDLRQSNFPLQPAFPLLLAGALEWFGGAVEETADPLNTGEVHIAGPADKVYAPDGVELPFVLRDDELHVLAMRAGVYRVAAAQAERRIALNIPPLPALRWNPAEAGTASPVRLGGRSAGAIAPEAWRWLALLALLPLCAEWWLYFSKPGSQRRPAVTDRRSVAPGGAQ